MTMNQPNVPMVRIGDWTKEAWDIFVSDAGMFILGGLIFFLLSLLCFPVVYGPLTCGMYLMIFDRMGGGRVEVNRLFAGFDYFGPSFGAGLIYIALMFVAMIVTIVGFVLFVLPSLIGFALSVLIQTVFLFVFQLIVDRGMGATEAISVSYNKIKGNPGEFFLLAALLCLISMAGSSVMGLGSVLTVPLTLTISAVAYRDIFGLAAAWEPAMDICA